MTDALGGVTTYEYDDAGNVLKKTDAYGKVTTFTYDANDNKLTETDPLGHTKSWTYDAFNNLTSETDALGKTTTYTYGNNRRMTSRTDPLGRKSVDQWDYYWNRRLTHTDPAGAVTQYLHEPGMILTVDSTWDPRGALTKEYVHPNGTLASMTDALGHVTTYTYDDNGNRLTETKKRTKADGTVETLTTAWTYDAEGRVTKTTYPDGSTTHTTYNKVGKPLETKDPLGRVTTTSTTPSAG